MSERKQVAWQSLLQGKAIQNFGLVTESARVDLRGLVLADPSKSAPVPSPIGEIAFLTDTIDIKNANWKSIDFSNSQLNSLRFHDSTIHDCVFDKCSCEDWRMWRTTFANCTFVGADLREASLGAVSRGVRNKFQGVNFAEADLRGTAHSSAEFTRCIFRNTRLNGTDFGGSVFEDCIFEGDLSDVIFCNVDTDAKDLAPNQMRGVDFRKSTFRYVEFRRLNLDTVVFPEDHDEHIVVDHAYSQTLNRLIAVLADSHDPALKKVAAFFSFKQKWLGPKQQRGVLSKKDIVAVGGTDGLDAVLQILNDFKMTGPPSAHG